MSKFEVRDGAVFKDGEQIGTVEGGKFVPNEGLHHSTVKAVEKFLAEQNEGGSDKEKEKPKAKESDPEPVPGERGDIDIPLVKWRQRNWPADQFNELYPPSRLQAIGL